MAIVNTKSTAVTNADTKKQSSGFIAGGTLRESVATVAIAALDDNNSVFRLCRIHSSWRISEITLFNDAITSGAAFELGLYDCADYNSGAVINADLFGSTLALTTGSALGINQTFESADTDLNKIEKRVWELLGLASDPGRYYDLCLTGTTIGSAAGDISVRLRYVSGT